MAAASGFGSSLSASRLSVGPISSLGIGAPRLNFGIESESLDSLILLYDPMLSLPQSPDDNLEGSTG